VHHDRIVLDRRAADRNNGGAGWGKFPEAVRSGILHALELVDDCGELWREARGWPPAFVQARAERGSLPLPFFPLVRCSRPCRRGDLLAQPFEVPCTLRRCEPLLLLFGVQRPEL